MSVYNLTKKYQIPYQVIEAKSMIARLRGLLDTSKSYEKKVLYICPCSGIHTFGMQYPIDAVFMDINKTVSRIFLALKPNRITKTNRFDKAVLEFPAGSVLKFSIQIGDKLSIKCDE